MVLISLLYRCVPTSNMINEIMARENRSKTSEEHLIGGKNIEKCPLGQMNGEHRIFSPFEDFNFVC